jgi:hypothetical protein
MGRHKSIRSGRGYCKLVRAGTYVKVYTECLQQNLNFTSIVIETSGLYSCFAFCQLIKNCEWENYTLKPRASRLQTPSHHVRSN